MARPAFDHFRKDSGLPYPIGLTTRAFMAIFRSFLRFTALSKEFSVAFVYFPIFPSKVLHYFSRIFTMCEGIST
jgi:hypothetical protein